MSVKVVNRLPEQSFSIGRADEFARAVAYAFDEVAPHMAAQAVTLQRSAADPGLVEVRISLAGADHVVGAETPELLLRELIGVLRSGIG